MIIGHDIRLVIPVDVRLTTTTEGAPWPSGGDIYTALFGGYEDGRYDFDGEMALHAIKNAVKQAVDREVFRMTRAKHGDAHIAVPFGTRMKALVEAEEISATYTIDVTPGD